MLDIAWISSDKKQDNLYDELCFDKVFFIESFGENKWGDGVVIEAKTKEDLMRKIDKIKGKYQFIIVLGGSNEANRNALENKDIDILLNPEREKEKDFMHYRNSGLNQVLCKIAKENGKAIGINFSEIKKMKGKKDAEKLGRILQNIRLCKKYKVPIILASFAKNAKELVHSAELKSFARTLGIDKINEL